MSDTAGEKAGVVPAFLRDYRYKPRLISFQGFRVMGRWQVKTTVITVRGNAVHFPDVIEAASAQASQLLDGVPERGDDAGIAALIIHIGLAGVWLLLDWWVEGDRLAHRHFHASLDDPTRFTDVASRHIGPCVWEIAVQAHEREAWLRHVIANPSGPDLAGYIADGLSGTL